MKKMILITFLLGLLYSTVAQNRSVTFETTKAWREVIDKAKSEKKLVFVDCYTDWCGPCKMLAETVFTRDEVADYFNEHFVNAHFEMEKDDAKDELMERYNIQAYPTLLFIDPLTIEVVHRVEGAGRTIEWLINKAETALSKWRDSGGERSLLEDKSIAFESTKSWQELLDKAKSERKMIFVDCYTDKCVPCKWMEASVFTRDKVADYFNQHFVNAKYEMEKDQDRDIIKGYGIRAYPTFLFIDPATGDEIHRVVGAKVADVFFGEVEEASRKWEARGNR